MIDAGKIWEGEGLRGQGEEEQEEREGEVAERSGQEDKEEACCALTFCLNLLVPVPFE